MTSLPENGNKQIARALLEEVIKRTLHPIPDSIASEYVVHHSDIKGIDGTREHARILGHVSLLAIILGFASVLGCSRAPEPAPASSDTGKPTFAPPPPLTREERAKQFAAQGDAVCESLFRDNPGRVFPEALEWARHNPQALPGGASLEAMLTDLSDAGAGRMNVVTNVPFGDFLIIVTLPSDSAARQKVFASDARLRQVCGVESTKDYGQKYVGYPFPNKPVSLNLNSISNQRKTN